MAYWFLTTLKTLSTGLETFLTKWETQPKTNPETFEIVSNSFRIVSKRMGNVEWFDDIIQIPMFGSSLFEDELCCSAADAQVDSFVVYASVEVVDSFDCCS
jgi:hypothetical protein